MKKIANKKIIRTLSYRTMREKKWKNLIAVLAIGLTTLLFTALFTVGSSMVEAIQDGTFRQIGTNAHGGYKLLSLEEYEKIKAADGYRDISYDIVAGFAANPELNAIQTEVRYAEERAAQWSYSYPVEGRMPEEINECAASSKVLEALGVPLKPGEKVSITIASHDAWGNEIFFQEEFILSGFWYSNDAAHAQEFWISRKWLDENIDLLEQNYMERERENGLIHPEGSIQAFVWFDSSYDIESQMTALTERAGYSLDELDVNVNWGYAASVVDGVALMLGIGILGIIILSGYLIIYNIFYINVSADIRYYGLLKTIGTTGRQLRRMVRGQAFLLSAAGIPLGLLTGWFVGKGILPFFYGVMDTGGSKIVALNPWIFAGSAVFSLLVVYLSCIRSCRLATRVSPIEAVRYVENIQYKKKEKKSAKISAARLAAANMGRNKRKAVAVITSLSLSIILLNATYCLVKGFSFDKYVKDYLLADMQLSHYSAVNMASDVDDYEAVTKEAVDRIKEIPGVEAVRTVNNRSGKAVLPEDLLKKFAACWESDEMTSNPRYHQEMVAWVLESGETHGSCYCLSEDLFSELAINEGTFDVERFQQGGYALLLEDFNTSGWVSVGDKITMGSYDDDTLPSKELEIMAAAELPSALGTRSLILGGIRLLLCEKDFEELYDTRGSLHACIDVAKGQDGWTAAAINDLIRQDYPDLVLVTKDTLREEFARENQMFFAVGGLLGFILGLIGILNLMNAMITSILARRQEFAMMQAVGMTGKQLEQMLTMEGIWYGVWTLGIAATLGNAVSYGLIYMIGKNMAYFEWRFHFLPLAASVPVIVLISVILPVSCYHALCKKSIIERLRLAEM